MRSAVPCRSWPSWPTGTLPGIGWISVAGEPSSTDAMSSRQHIATQQKISRHKLLRYINYYNRPIRIYSVSKYVHILSSQVVIGEQIVGQDPDCSTCPPVQRFFPSRSDIVLHENFRLSRVQDQGNDILLIRLHGLVQTAMENDQELVLPICLPWKRGFESIREHLIAGWGELIGNAF